MLRYAEAIRPYHGERGYGPSSVGEAAKQDMREIVDWLLGLPESANLPDAVIMAQAMWLFKKKVQRDYQPQIKEFEQQARSFFLGQGRDQRDADRLSRLKGENELSMLTKLLNSQGIAPVQIPRMIFRPDEIHNIKPELSSYIAQVRNSRPKATQPDPEAYGWLQQYRGRNDLKKIMPKPKTPMHQSVDLPVPKPANDPDSSLRTPMHQPVLQWILANCKFARNRN